MRGPLQTPGALRRAMLKWVAFGMVLPTRLVTAASDHPSVEKAPEQFPGSYRGTLGAAAIEVELALQTDAEDSLEGWYLRAGDSNKILLAGEFEGQKLSMEESRNGRDVSGTWSGELVASSLSGIWRDADESVELPFQLTRLAPPPRQ